MWALLRRANTLGITSDWQYRSLAVEMSSLGYRFNEPGKVDGEQPTAVSAAISWHLGHGRDIGALARTALLTRQEFTHLYGYFLRCSDSGGVGAASGSVTAAACEAIR